MFEGLRDLKEARVLLLDEKEKREDKNCVKKF